MICSLHYVWVYMHSKPDLVQVEDSSRDPLDTVHHPLRIWRPLASHCYVLVQVQLPSHRRVLRLRVCVKEGCEKQYIGSL